MSAFAALVLKNAAAVDVTFNPSSIDAAGVATWVTNASVFDAKERVTMSVSLAKNGSTVSRIKQKVTIPIMDTVDTSLKLAEAYATIEVVIPKSSTSTHRLDLRKHCSTLLDHAVSTAAFTDLESIY